MLASPRSRRLFCLAALAATVAALGLMAAESADAKGLNCARPNTVTLARSADARIWRPRGALGYRLYGCLKSIDRAFRLDRNTGRPAFWAFGGRPGIGPAAIPRWLFAGRFVGIWAAHLGRAELWVYSLRSGRMAVRVQDFWGAPEGGVTDGPRLATNGVPVWIHYAGDEGLYSSYLDACRDAGGSAWALPCSPFNAMDEGVAVTTLDSGPEGSLTGLRITGTTVRYRKAGVARSRSVRSLGS